MRPKTSFSNRWWRLALVPVLLVLAAFFFQRYLGAAFAYSGKMGLPSLAQETQLAYRDAWLFLALFLTLEALSVIILVSVFGSVGERSAILSFVANYGVGLLFSLTATGIFVWLQLVFLR